MSVPEQLQSQIDAHEREHAVDSLRFARLSLEERGRLVRAACRSAAMIYENRLSSGLPPHIREEWPPSTWDFLKRHARRVSRGSAEA